MTDDKANAPRRVPRSPEAGATPQAAHSPGQPGPLPAANGQTDGTKAAQTSGSGAAGQENAARSASAMGKPSTGQSALGQSASGQSTSGQAAQGNRAQGRPGAGGEQGAPPGAAGQAAQAQAGRVQFDTSALKSSYCNVCNGSSTREEVVLNFGLNTSWDRSGDDRLQVALHHRVILSPQAAKRVRDMMVRLIEEHEARYGKLDG